MYHLNVRVVSAKYWVPDDRDPLFQGDRDTIGNRTNFYVRASVSTEWFKVGLGYSQVIQLSS